jgi:hypothetical protein
MEYIDGLPLGGYLQVRKIEIQNSKRTRWLSSPKSATP